MLATRSGDNQSVRSSVPVVSRWLWPGNRTFLEVASMMVTWWIVAFVASEVSFLSLMHNLCTQMTGLPNEYLCICMY